MTVQAALASLELVISKKKITVEKISPDEINNYNSNTMIDVNYISKDTKGNEYVINAKTGEIGRAHV